MYKELTERRAVGRTLCNLMLNETAQGALNLFAKPKVCPPSFELQRNSFSLQKFYKQSNFFPVNKYGYADIYQVLIIDIYL